jgi:hypothetical protein
MAGVIVRGSALPVVTPKSEAQTHSIADASLTSPLSLERDRMAYFSSNAFSNNSLTSADASAQIRL